MSRLHGRPPHRTSARPGTGGGRRRDPFGLSHQQTRIGGVGRAARGRPCGPRLAARYLSSALITQLLRSLHAIDVALTAARPPRAASNRRASGRSTPRTYPCLPCLRRSHASRASVTSFEGNVSGQHPRQGRPLPRSGSDRGAHPRRATEPDQRGPRIRILSRGDQGDQMFIIISGKVKIGGHSRDGREGMFTLRGPSESFGELSVFDPVPRRSTAMALNDVRAAPVDGVRLRAWIADHPGVAERLLRVLARRLRRTDDNLSDLIFTDVSGRLAKQLLHLAQRFGVQEDGAWRLSHDLTQEELAHWSDRRGRRSTRRCRASPSAAGSASTARARSSPNRSTLPDAHDDRPRRWLHPQDGAGRNPGAPSVVGLDVTSTPRHGDPPVVRRPTSPNGSSTSSGSTTNPTSTTSRAPSGTGPVRRRRTGRSALTPGDSGPVRQRGQRGGLDPNQTRGARPRREEEHVGTPQRTIQ